MYLVLEYGNHWRHLKNGYLRPELYANTILDFGSQESTLGHFWCSDHRLSPNSLLWTSMDTFCADTIVTENESRPAGFIVDEFLWTGFISWGWALWERNHLLCNRFYSTTSPTTVPNPKAHPTRSAETLQMIADKARCSLWQFGTTVAKN